MPIRTQRLRLQPVTVALARADLAGRETLARALGAAVPPEWPPEHFDRPAIENTLIQLEAGGPGAEWAYFYLIREDLGPSGPTTAGIAGYKGPPTGDGCVEVGYSVLQGHQRLGLATEALAAIVDRAFEDPAVLRMLAETLPSLLPFIRVLEKSGFHPIGPGSEAGVIGFELSRADYEAGRTYAPPHLRTLVRLVSHMHWADEQVRAALIRQPDPQAWRLYAHVLSAELLWLARLHGDLPPLPVWPDLDQSDALALSLHLREDLRSFLWRLEIQDLGRLIWYRNSAGDHYQSTVEDILLHLCLHGSYHRGQIARRLREAGSDPAPTDYIGFVRGAPAATTKASLRP